MSNSTGDKGRVSRRDFLGLASLLAALLSSFTVLAGVFKMTKAPVHFEESKKFKIGMPDEFPVGTVKKLDAKRVFIFSDNDGLHAISSVCTHLGCLVSHTVWGFQCPFHGSKYDKNGKVTAGPAPRSLSWHEISQHVDGSLVVDTAKDIKPGTKFFV
jgi:cytochrome b6-f complex iron-sulfur subunit